VVMWLNLNQALTPGEFLFGCPPPGDSGLSCFESDAGGIGGVAFYVRSSTSHAPSAVGQAGVVSVSAVDVSHIAGTFNVQAVVMDGGGYVSVSGTFDAPFCGPGIASASSPTCSTGAGATSLEVVLPVLAILLFVRRRSRWEMETKHGRSSLPVRKECK
jgi:hypothetical protein